jgi:hypothetical protein
VAREAAWLKAAQAANQRGELVGCLFVYDLDIQLVSSDDDC